VVQGVSSNSKGLNDNFHGGKKGIYLITPILISNGKNPYGFYMIIEYRFCKTLFFKIIFIKKVESSFSKFCSKICLDIRSSIRRGKSNPVKWLL
jgi:hypothetical protein